MGWIGFIIDPEVFEAGLNLEPKHMIMELII